MMQKQTALHLINKQPGQCSRTSTWAMFSNIDRGSEYPVSGFLVGSGIA